MLKGKRLDVAVALTEDELELIALLLEQWELQSDAPSLVVGTVRDLRTGFEHARDAGLEVQRQAIKEGVRLNVGTLRDMLRGGR